MSLRVEGNEQDILKVITPSYCLHHFNNALAERARQKKMGMLYPPKLPIDHDYYWAIISNYKGQHLDDERVAYLILGEPASVEKYKKMGAKIVPAYYRHKEGEITDEGNSKTSAYSIDEHGKELNRSGNEIGGASSNGNRGKSNGSSSRQRRPSRKG